MLIRDHSASIEACRFCFMCRHMCTLGVTSGRESDTPRGKGLLLFKILKGHVQYSDDLVETIYRCCLCGLCRAWCKASFSPPEAVLAARADIVAQDRQPPAVRQIRDAILATGNPFGLPRDERFRAIDASGAKSGPAEVLYYAGCDATYQRPEIANALLKILRHARVDFSLLPDEISTGKPLWLLGYRDDARTLAADLLQKIRRSGCRVLVTSCPSSLDAFRTDFPAMGLDLSGIEVLHATQYLDRLAAQNRLALTNLATQVTPLDGTYLGRYHAIFDEPRRLLGRIPGLTVHEMGWTRELAHSCGEPGGLFRLLHPQESRRLAARVLAEAATAHVPVLATTCPATKTALLDAPTPSLRVLDVLELVAQAL